MHTYVYCSNVHNSKDEVGYAGREFTGPVEEVHRSHFVYPAESAEGADELPCKLPRFLEFTPKPKNKYSPYRTSEEA